MTDPANAEGRARTHVQAMWAHDHASRGLGMELIEVSSGRVVMRMVIRDDMANGFGMCHGGFIFTLADTAFAFACNAQGVRAVAATCTITYLRPGKVGDQLTAVAQERESAGRTGIYDVGVRDSAGIVVAEFRGLSRTIGPSVAEGSLP